MGIAWPLALVGLLVPLGLLAAYVWQQRRRRRLVVRHSNISLVRAAAPRQPGWKRHLPVALVLAALTVLVAAAARPQVEMTVSRSGAAVILALDVSGSMCATDVEPNRLSAAQDAVRSFVEAQEDSTKIGLVVFSGSARLAVAPTTERQPLVDAIDSVTTGRGTTIGAAILASIDAIAAIDPRVPPAESTTTDDPGPLPDSGSGGEPLTEGEHVPEIVVLLTDGKNTRGVTPDVAAAQAAERGVRVYPIAFGTTNPTALSCTAEQLGGGSFQGFGSGRGGDGPPRSILVVDEPALMEVAETTGGTFHKADDAAALQDVLEELPNQVDKVKQPVEISAALVGLGILLLLAGVAAAARWTPFPG